MNETNEKHKQAMRQVKEEHQERIKTKKEAETGLLMIFTGDGKGKSTAAFGTIVRALGWDHKVGVVQFIKGKWKTGEKQFFNRFSDLVDFRVMGEGFTWETQDREQDIAAAKQAWDLGRKMLESGDYDLVVLDEINIVLRYDYLSATEVQRGLEARHPRTTVIVTGRDAPQELVDAADLVTVMDKAKHPFDAGIKAARGIDF